MKVVIDTNVFVSGLNFPGNPREILKLFRIGEIRVYISPFILKETEKVLLEKFFWNKEKTNKALSLIKKKSFVISPKSKISIIREKDSDNRILECAVSAEAQFIISGDRKHLLPLKEFRGIKIVSPAGFLRIF